jgi:hypothetical protein
MIIRPALVPAILLLLFSGNLLAQRTGTRPAPTRTPGRSSSPSTTTSPNSLSPTRGTGHYANEEGAIEFRSETVLAQVPAVANSLSGVSGRKSLIWATGGFPFYIDSPAAVPGGYLSVLYERAMQSLNDAEVAVFPVDVRGLLNYSPTADVS